MRKRPVDRPGTLHLLRHDSTALAGNRPGDPTERVVAVYTPHGYDPHRTYPLFVDLVGYTGSGLAHTNWRPFGLNLVERLDALIARGDMGPVVAVLPDCFTRWGGNQYIDSTATGAYMTYLCDEIVPFVEERFSAGGRRERRAVFGKSSGGYGAMLHAMERPDVWGATACHSGDAYFEYCYLADFPRLARVLLKHEGSVDRFLAVIDAKEKLDHDESIALMALGMAAHYDPDPTAPHGFQLPFDPHTGRLRVDRWAHWLAHDPVRLIPERADALRTLRGLYVDCGRRDQYHLLWGARMMHEAMLHAGVAHEYQEFDDDHSDVDYRMDTSLPFLYRALAE